jgi:hypothetical protein
MFPMLLFQFLVFRARHLRRPLLQLRRLHLREHETKEHAAVFCHSEVYSGVEKLIRKADLFRHILLTLKNTIATAQ